MSKNNFVLAAEALGFNSEAKQNALLKIFSLAGYFSGGQVWQDLLHLDKANAQYLWQQIFSSLKKAHADNPELFDPTSLHENFKPESTLSVKMWEDYLLYVGQHAFSRSLGVERYQIQAKEWMTIYQAEYLEAAKILELIDRTNPARAEYDEAWIAGASRIGMLTRIVDYGQLVASGLKVDHTVVLAGARPAWANIDGISPEVLAKLNEAHKSNINIDEVNVALPVGEELSRIEEGKAYLFAIAQKEGIRLNQEQPFIKYDIAAECPKGLFVNREYPNYDKDETKRITETVIANDLLKEYLPEMKISLCDTEAQDGERPNTITTSYDAAKTLLKHQNLEVLGTDEYNLHVLMVSNNPYVDRQREAAQSQANKAAKEFNKQHHTQVAINVDGAGFCAKQDVATLHSELAALLAEKWKKLHSGENGDHLFYQTRNHDYIDSPCPELDLAGQDVHYDLAA